MPTDYLYYLSLWQCLRRRRVCRHSGAEEGWSYRIDPRLCQLRISELQATSIASRV